MDAPSALAARPIALGLAGGLALFLLVLASPATAQTLEVSVGGKVHADARAFPGGPAADDPGFLLRRFRVGAEVELDGWLRLTANPGFGEGEVELVDGYAEADLRPGSRLVVRAGKFKLPVGYESLRSSSHLRFGERALPTALVPRRDLGVMVAAKRTGAEVQVGLFNGVRDGSSSPAGWGSGPDVAARAFVGVGGGLSVGVGAAVGTAREDGGAGEALTDYETSGDRAFFAYAPGVVPDGLRYRVAPQATFHRGRLSLLAEGAVAGHRVRRADGGAGTSGVAHAAWLAEASVVLVGTPRGERRPVPTRAVPEGGPGAVEVSARLHGFAADPDAAPLATEASARDALAGAVAVHWTPAEYVRLGLTAERTTFGAFAGEVPLESETFVLLRAQVEL
jgi:phosphate-selective porin OprO/OprP